MSNCHTTRVVWALHLCQHRAWQHFTARLLIWFIGWVHSLMPPNGLLVRILPTWRSSSALQTLKELHGNLLTHYNCTEWAPPPADDAPAPDAPAQGHDDDSARPLSLPPLTFSIHCVFGRMRTMAKLLLVRRYLHNVRSQSTSCKRGRCMNRYDAKSAYGSHARCTHVSSHPIGAHA